MNQGVRKYEPITTRQSYARQAGLSIMEVMVVIFISSIVIVALARFLVFGYPISRTTILQQRSTETARVHLKRITKSLREIRPSDIGSYPLVGTEPQRIIYYADIDSDSSTERVRIELQGTELVRGVVKPSGDPLSYDLGSEVETVIMTGIQNGADPVFRYYSGDYPVDTTELNPTDLTEVKYMEFELLVDADPAVDPPAVEVKSQVQLRNLKTNLGEVAASPTPTP